jgi:hypothetical protein
MLNFAAHMEEAARDKVARVEDQLVLREFEGVFSNLQNGHTKIERVVNEA